MAGGSGGFSWRRRVFSSGRAAPACRLFRPRSAPPPSARAIWEFAGSAFGADRLDGCVPAARRAHPSHRAVPPLRRRSCRADRRAGAAPAGPVLATPAPEPRREGRPRARRTPARYGLRRRAGDKIGPERDAWIPHNDATAASSSLGTTLGTAAHHAPLALRAHNAPLFVNGNLDIHMAVPGRRAPGIGEIGPRR